MSSNSKPEYLQLVPTVMPHGRAGSEKSTNRKVDSLVRERDSIRRLLDQADLSMVSEGLESLKKRLHSIETRLSGEED